MIELRPDICSLDMGSMNLGETGFVNTPTHLGPWRSRSRDAGVTPELEVFETGHVLLLQRLIEDGHVTAPGPVPDLPRHRLGPAGDAGAMSYMRSLLPPDCTWFAFGISLQQFPMVAQAVLLGGHPRVGLEDNLYLEKGKLAPSNAALVEKAGKIIEMLGDKVATPADARAAARAQWHGARGLGGVTRARSA